MALRDSDDLNLPDAPDFISTPPKYSLKEMIALCEPLLPFWNTQRYSKPEPHFIGDAFRIVDEDENA